MITVFTPTYNRAYIIRALYESLCRQSSRDFEWIVVDDGSTDNTRELIRSFQDEGRITIRYFYQQNAGKHIAINKGVQEAQGELFFIVDSDDYLADKAVEEIEQCYKDIADDNHFAGLSGVRITPDGRRIGGEVDYEILDCSLLDFTYKYRYKGDMAEVYKTAIMRRYAFPSVPGEKFCSEAYVWAQIAQQYKLRYTCKKWYICNYQPDGLTANSIKTRMMSPQSAVMVYDVLLKCPMPLLQKIKHGINIWRFAICSTAGMKQALRAAPWWTYACTPISLFMHLRDAFKVHENKKQK